MKKNKLNWRGELGKLGTLAEIWPWFGGYNLELWLVDECGTRREILEIKGEGTYKKSALVN